MTALGNATSWTGPAPTHLLLADIELQENCRMAVVEDDGLLELAASIREIGVLQSLLVEPRRGGFALVAGYRRHRAAEIAGCTTVPVAVIAPGLDPRTANLVENLHRVDLSPIEKGRALVKMRDGQGKSQYTLARETGWTQATVSKYIAFATQLIPDAQEAMHAGTLGWKRAGELLGQPPEVQARMLATGPGRDKPLGGGRKSMAESAMIAALAAFRRGEEDAALVSARQAVHELERRQRDGRTATPRQAPAPKPAQDVAERRRIAAAAAPTRSAGAVRPGNGTARLTPPPAPVLAPVVLPPAGQRQVGIDHLDDDCPPGRPKVKCCDCKQWLSVPALSTSRKRLLAHREITACDVTSQLKALPK